MILLVNTFADEMADATYPQEVCIVVESEEERELVNAFIKGRVGA